ncbi:MAG: hypothetical protein DMF69_23060 [Acidobacteria bacterium]|nr:MAG: hypothetical protein DMF69_23060 [Acidobacteriota bacterium]
MNRNGRNQLRLNIGSLDVLGYALGLSPEDPFIKISNPAPFAADPIEPKQRKIDNPILITKEIQKRINRSLLRPLHLPGHICGGVKGKTLLDNIIPHLNARVIVTADIKGFFPSITTFQVYAIWSRLLGCSPEIAAILTRLTTFERRLPQGAPTSSTLANLILFSFDQPIRSFCAQHGITYTTWVDDLIFSGAESRSVINVAVAALREGGFSLPHKKLKIMTAGKRMRVTGVLLGKKPGVIRRYARDTRAGIYRLTKGDLAEPKVDRYVKSIRGRIAHINRLNPNVARSLDHQFQLALKRAVS